MLLKQLEKSGIISDLELQPSYELQPGFRMKDGTRVRAITYRPDFRYKEKDGHVVVEDVKGAVTEVYKLKKKMLLYKYENLDFREVH